MKTPLLRLLACSVISLCSATVGFAQEKLTVVATFSIIGDFASQVGGDRIELKTLVGANGDAHVYEPKPADAIALARADVVLTNGLELEGFLDRLITASATEADVITLTDGIEPREEPGGGHYHFVDGKAVFHAGAYDPHAWQSVTNARIYVENIVEAFCAADAEGCDAYAANAENYLGELDALHAQILESVEALPEDRRTVVVAHNAFGYFESAYGIGFLSPQGVSTDSEASAADVAGLIREIRNRNAGAIFSENIADTRLIDQIATESGMPISAVLYSDALSGPDGAATSYIAMMQHNAQAITSGLAVH